MIDNEVCAGVGCFGVAGMMVIGRRHASVVS